jgi:hypothetical protein
LSGHGFVTAYGVVDLSVGPIGQIIPFDGHALADQVVQFSGQTGSCLRLLVRRK